MPNVISDCSALIILDSIELFQILKELYGKVTITEEVSTEFGNELPPWVEVKKVMNSTYTLLLQNFVDLGEASSLALALESPQSLLIIDDLKARKLARNLKLTITGTLGIILKAKERGIIPSVVSVIQKMKNQGFYISDELVKEIVELTKE